MTCFNLSLFSIIYDLLPFIFDIKKGHFVKKIKFKELVVIKKIMRFSHLL